MGTVCVVLRDDIRAFAQNYPKSGGKGMSSPQGERKGFIENILSAVLS